MIAGISLQRRQFGSRRIALVAHAVERDAQCIGRQSGIFGRLNRFFGRLRCILGRLAANNPAQHQTAQKSEDNDDDDNDGVQINSLSDKNEKRT